MQFVVSILAHSYFLCSSEALPVFLICIFCLRWDVLICCWGFGSLLTHAVFVSLCV